MKTLFTVLMLAGTMVLLGQGPTLTVQDARGNRVALHVAELTIGVQFVADVAETTITIGFRNDTDRMLEGEFAMVLPEGATVSRYALEVNGAMRESVAVEKEKARYAYESIKRQMVDPGFVEREKGNVYRTRIFPILKKSVKRVRLGYVMPLPAEKEGLRYELPIGGAGKIGEVNCRLEHLEGENLQVLENAGLPIERAPRAVFDSKWLDLTPGGTLVVIAPAPEAQEALIEKDEDGASYVYVRSQAEPVSAVPRPNPARIQLIWDVSRSGASRDHKREMEFLDAWFRAVGKVEVRVLFLRHKVIDHGSVAVENGDWTEVRKLLAAATYDSATRFDLLELEEVEEDLVLLFTDGISPFAPKAGISRPLLWIDAAESPAPTAFRALARESGGAYLDLLGHNAAEAVRRCSTIPPRLEMDDWLVDPLVDDFRAAGKYLRVQGRLPENAGDAIEIGGRRLEWSKATKVENGLVRRLWAQRKLSELEASHPHPRKEIVAHGKKHNLVSDYTSLIVLERFEDYLRYRIPPPEPELRAKWAEEMRSNEPSWYRFKQAWAVKRDWHGREFEWMEEALTPRLTQVTIWLQSLDQVFERENLDGKALEVVANWRRKTLMLIDRRAEWAKRGEAEGWRRAVAQLVSEGSKLKETPIALPEEGRPLVVSVRGLVRNPGNVVGTKDLTLKKAIERAGGVSALGTPSAVELYRNGGKVIYNMLSARFEDVPLMPGDMIAVREYNPEIAGSWNEWGDLPRDSNPRSAPAVFDHYDLWVSLDRYEDGEGGADPFGGEADPFGGDDKVRRSRGALDLGEEGQPEEGALQGELRVVAPGKINSPGLAEFEQTVKSGSAPAAYHKLVAAGPLAASIYVEAARTLFAQKENELGEQMLSNLLEMDVFLLEPVRACAMWLHEFGRTEAARELLTTLEALVPNAPLTKWDLAHFGLRMGNEAAVSELLTEMVGSAPGGNSTAAGIALTERNGLLATGRIPPPRVEVPVEVDFQKVLGLNLDADMRVVVTTSHPEFRFGLSVRDPSGASGGNLSATGGRLERGPGLSEYMLRRALPGEYLVQCSASQAMTARIVFYQDWGRESEIRKEVTVWLPGGREPVELGTYEFQYQKE